MTVIPSCAPDSMKLRRLWTSIARRDRRSPSSACSRNRLRRAATNANSTATKYPLAAMSATTPSSPRAVSTASTSFSVGGHGWETCYRALGATAVTPAPNGDHPVRVVYDRRAPGGCNGSDANDDIEGPHPGNTGRGASFAGRRIRVLHRRGHRMDHGARRRLRPRRRRHRGSRRGDPTRPDRAAGPDGHRRRRSFPAPSGPHGRIRRAGRIGDRHRRCARLVSRPLDRLRSRRHLQRGAGVDTGDGCQPAGPPCPNAGATPAVERRPVVRCEQRAACSARC